MVPVRDLWSRKALYTWTGIFLFQCVKLTTIITISSMVSFRVGEAKFSPSSGLQGIVFLQGIVPVLQEKLKQHPNSFGINFVLFFMIHILHQKPFFVTRRTWKLNLCFSRHFYLDD